MQSNRFGISPGGVGVAGLGASLCALVALWLGYGLSWRELGAAAIGAMAAIAGSTLFVGVHSWQNRNSQVSYEKTAHQARHDNLTGLVNRIALFEELEQSVKGSRDAGTVLGVMFLDLDRFKVINDSMGHEAGDELLRIIAGRLKHTVRGSDVVARFGGDEFVIITRDLLSEKSVLAVAEQILKTFAAPVSLYGSNLVVSTSIGVAIARPDDVRTGEELVRDADAAMYKAKRSRSGYAVFDEIQRQEVTTRLDTERDLTGALDSSQFVVHYQPLISVSTRSLYGFEALVRWQHPTRGLLGPAEFLAVAEETGMMARIGEMVLREACAQAAVWNHLNPDAKQVKMSVNIAEQQLLDSNFPLRVQEILAWSNLDPSQLQLEIIEDVVIDHLDGLSVLREIQALGVSLAIDDFGTGQSSLSYVKQFDMVSSLKIDKTFVDEMGGASRAIIEAITAMAKALGLQVIAEGVESTDQVRQLLDYGIDVMQGYLFSKPVPATEIDPVSWFGVRPSAGPIGPAAPSPEHSLHQGRPERRA